MSDTYPHGKDDVLMRRILTTRTEVSTLGSLIRIATLECGHEVIAQPNETERACVQCRDELVHSAAVRKARKP